MLLGAGVAALVLAFQGIAELPVVVAQFVVSGAMFLFLFQALLGGRSLPVPKLGSRDGGYSRPQQPGKTVYSESIQGTLWPDEAAWCLGPEVKRNSGFAPEEIVIRVFFSLFTPCPKSLEKTIDGIVQFGHLMVRMNLSRTRLLMASAIGCGLLASAASPPAVKVAWDWSGVRGTGQSLAVGQMGLPALSTNQPYGNLKLFTGDLQWPVNPDDTNLALVPLIEPIGRKSPSYPSSWPENIAGETPHTAMANEMSFLVRAASGGGFISVHSEVGENGQGMVFLKKNATPRGVNGRSYEAALIETKAIARLAKAAGKTYGVGAITLTHGESDAGNANYEAQMYQLWSDYNADLRAITGQTQKILMILSQQDALNNNRSASTLAQWKVGVDHPDDIVCAGPKYQYPYASDGLHLTALGYQLLGEKYAEVYFQRVILRPQ